MNRSKIINKLKSLAWIPVIVLVIAIPFFIILFKPARIIKAPAAFKARIAIVIDDWGYNLKNLEIAKEIKYPFTAAVLPNLPYSATVARQLHAQGIEIILHLPMEPAESSPLEKNTIFTSFDGETITRIVTNDLNCISYAKGVSNHMGSKATRNKKTMEALFRELKKRNLYFLDNLVTSGSVCPELGEKCGLPVAKRDVFLDNQQAASYIKHQIVLLKQLAKAKGVAVGVGHDRRLTVGILKEAMPQLEKEGYKLVFLSEVAAPVTN